MTKLSSGYKNMKAIDSAPIDIFKAETAQDQQDDVLSAKPQLMTHEQFDDLVNEKNQANPQLKAPSDSDPIEQAIKDNPTLTREKAEEMARAFGF